MIRLAPLSSFALAVALAVAAPTGLMPRDSRAAEIAISVTVPPPALPVYAQPVIPGPGYMWMPGYWAWGPGGYYWVPGTWILPPAVGLLWTPGYWGWVDGRYFWHAGYWGPTVGFYGGINYGFGYFGIGYVGGHWDHDRFFYNRTVNNFGNVRITNVYNTPVRNVALTHVSFNGGRDGTSARPTAQQEAAGHEHHFDATAAQTQHEHAASQNHGFQASVNHGRPSVGATAHPASFAGVGVTHARRAAPTSHAQSQAPVRQTTAQPSPQPQRQNGGGHHAAPRNVAPDVRSGGQPQGSGQHGGGDHGGGEHGHH